MPGTLRDDIRQSAAFTSIEQEAMLNVLRTASQLLDALDDLLRDKGIGSTQYNVLRILRGAGPRGLCRNDLRDRMLTRMPDMTRLLDRLEAVGLVERVRDSDDRRMVFAHLTEKGRQLVEELDEPVDALHREKLGHLEEGQLCRLIELLTLVRAAC